MGNKRASGAGGLFSKGFSLRGMKLDFRRQLAPEECFLVLFLVKHESSESERQPVPHL